MRSVLHHIHCGCARLFEIWGVAGEPVQASLGVGDGGGNRLIHFVRQGGGQLRHGGHPVDACEIRPRFTQSFFGALLLRQGGDRREGQNDEGNAGNRQRQAGLIETCIELGLVNRAVSGKNGGPHPRVVHAGDGQAHDDRRSELLPEIRGSECQP